MDGQGKVNPAFGGEQKQAGLYRGPHLDSEREARNYEQAAGRAHRGIGAEQGQTSQGTAGLGRLSLEDTPKRLREVRETIPYTPHNLDQDAQETYRRMEKLQRVHAIQSRSEQGPISLSELLEGQRLLRELGYSF